MSELVNENLMYLYLRHFIVIKNWKYEANEALIHQLVWRLCSYIWTDQSDQ